MYTNSEIQRPQLKWLIFAILSFSYILVYFHRLCASVLAVELMRDLNADGSLMGLLGAAYFYPYAVMQIPAGLLSDSWGARKTITLFFIVACAGSIILGLAPTVFWAILGRTLVGVGVAMLFVPTLKILAEWFTPREFATMTGLMLAMGGIGSLIATSPLVWLNNWMGWRRAFVLVGLLTLVVAALVWLFVRNRRRRKCQPLALPSKRMPKIRPSACGAGCAKYSPTVIFGLWGFGFSLISPFFSQSAMPIQHRPISRPSFLCSFVPGSLLVRLCFHGRPFTDRSNR